MSKPSDLRRAGRHRSIPIGPDEPHDVMWTIVPETAAHSSRSRKGVDVGHPRVRRSYPISLVRILCKVVHSPSSMSRAVVRGSVALPTRPEFQCKQSRRGASCPVGRGSQICPYPFLWQKATHGGTGQYRATNGSRRLQAEPWASRSRENQLYRLIPEGTLYHEAAAMPIAKSTLEKCIWIGCRQKR